MDAGLTFIECINSINSGNVQQPHVCANADTDKAAASLSLGRDSLSWQGQPLAEEASKEQKVMALLSCRALCMDADIAVSARISPKYRPGKVSEVSAGCWQSEQRTAGSGEAPGASMAHCRLPNSAVLTGASNGQQRRLQEQIAFLWPNEPAETSLCGHKRDPAGRI